MRTSFSSLTALGITTKCDRTLRVSWVFGRASCLLQHAFSLVSKRIRCQRVIDYRAAPPLIILHFARHTGVLLACFTVDYRVLFEPLTEEIVQDGFQYYRTFYNAPPGIKVRRVSFSLF